MSLNLTVLVSIVACAVLVIVWFKKMRNPRGFLWLLGGLGMIYLLSRSDGQILSMLGIIVTFFTAAVLLTFLSALIFHKGDEK